MVNGICVPYMKAFEKFATINTVLCVVISANVSQTRTSFLRSILPSKIDIYKVALVHYLSLVLANKNLVTVTLRDNPFTIVRYCNFLPISIISITASGTVEIFDFHSVAADMQVSICKIRIIKCNTMNDQRGFLPKYRE